MSAPYFPTGPTGGGVRSLAVDIYRASDPNTGSDKSFTLALTAKVCPSSVSASGIAGAFHGSIYFKPNDGLGDDGEPAFIYPNNNGQSVASGGDSNVFSNKWVTIASGSFGGAAFSEIQFNVGISAGRTGTLYFDNFYFDN